MSPHPRPRASGLGSLPGLDPERAARDTFAAFGDDDGVPYLPELPARGVGADLVGRGAALLVDLPVDLQPSGWRLVPRPGRDLGRARSWWRQDLDVLAEVAHTWDGTVKVQVPGPWTLAASLWLPRLERVVADAGAVRDVAGSLEAGVRVLLGDLRRLVPGARFVLQVDEPSLPGVLGGTLPTASGLGRLRAVEAPVVGQRLGDLVATAKDAGADQVVVHTCAPAAPVAVLAGCGADALALDVALLGTPGWEALAGPLEAGLGLWAGVVPTTGALPGTSALLEKVVRPWRGLGLDPALLRGVVVTPACGLAGAPDAPARLRAALAVAAALGQESTR